MLAFNPFTLLNMHNTLPLNDLSVLNYENFYSGVWQNGQDMYITCLLLGETFTSFGFFVNYSQASITATQLILNQGLTCMQSLSPYQMDTENALVNLC